MPRLRDELPDDADPEVAQPLFRDDPDSDEAASRDGGHDALSFLAIDGEAGHAEDGDVAPYQQKHYLLEHIPPRALRAWRATAEWTKGPDPPRLWKITPLFEDVQTAPLRLKDRFFPKPTHKFWLLVAFLGCWLLVFSLVLWKSSFAEDVPGYGAPANIGCGARFWVKGNACGLNGDECRPFANSTFAFRCPASCLGAQVLEPYAVGAQEINYRPLVIGGPPPGSHRVSESVYRGDSFICSAAIHAGYLSNKEGGCGVVQLVGEHDTYHSTKHNDIKSISFDTSFPLSYSFIEGTQAKCQDLRWPLLAVSLVFSILLSLFTTSPGVFFWTIFTGLFFHVALVSDPPSVGDYRALVSTAIGRFLPSAFVAAVLYYTTIRYTLSGLRAQVEKTVLWLGACWAGALNNYTFDKIPISRLTPHDLRQQPGAIPALLAVIAVILGAALWQAWCIRIEGKMRPYLALYGAFVASLLILVAVPSMKVRIHHYILALLLLPGTFPQTRPGLLFQGLLVGLFINGIARWGYDPLLQTALELRGDAPVGSKLPQILPPIVHNNFDSIGMAPNITFEWEQPPQRFGYDGISVLVNDVERYRAYDDQRGHDGSGRMRSFTWVRGREGLPEYFRFAFMQGSSAMDYTKAGTWDVDGSWAPMKPGPSK